MGTLLSLLVAAAGFGGCEVTRQATGTSTAVQNIQYRVRARDYDFAAKAGGVGIQWISSGK